MKKSPLDLVKAKLNKYHLSALTADELRIYFAHRLEKILREKKILTANELVYLLCETGPGDRRFDPRHIPLLTQESFFTTSLYGSIPEIAELGDKKKDVDEYLAKHRDSESTQNLLLKALGIYIKSVKVISRSPFIIEGNFGKTPISCLIENGQWVLPDAELFSFLRQTQQKKRLPIVMAKKMSGILFPMFKGVSVMGLNFYKTYLPKEAKKVIETATLPADGLLRELRYCDQFQYLTKEYVDGITDEYWVGDPLKNFFEVILPSYAEGYHQRFLDLKIQIAGNFINTVSQFRKNKATRGLLDSYEMQENLVHDLNKATRKQS